MLRKGLVRPQLDDPATVTVLGALAAALSLVPLGAGAVVGTIQGLVGAALVLLTGQALRLALRPSPAQDAGPTARMERWAWTIALSLATPVLGAFVLDVGPGGIARAGWAVLLGAVTVVAAGVAWFRGDRPGARPRLRLPGPRAVVTTAATVVILGLALTLGVNSAAAVPAASFTELSLVPRDTDAVTGVPVADPSGLALVTVRSSEDRDRGYHLELQNQAGVTVQVVALQLAPGESWEQDVRVPVSRAVLYRDPDREPYRQVWSGEP
jgi:uncharacterized membrane protein